MKVLLIGSNGREHALAGKLAESPLLTELFCAPGNGGTATIAKNVDLKVSNTGALALWAMENGIDLAIVGDPAALSDGIVDIFLEHGIPIFGPTKAAFQLERSWAFAQELSQKGQVPTVTGCWFENANEAARYMKEKDGPFLLYAEQASAVRVAGVDDGVAALAAFASTNPGRVYVAENAVGEEVSLVAITDGLTVLPFVLSQPHRASGPAGDDSYPAASESPTQVLGDRRVENLVGTVFVPLIREMNARGMKYCGFLRARLLVDSAGSANVIEFGCALHGLDAQVLLPRLHGDIFKVISAAVDGRLASVELHWKAETAAAILLRNSKGHSAPLNPHLTNENDLFFFHEETKIDSEGQTVTSGERVMTVSAIGRDLADAVRKIEMGIGQAILPGMSYRRDLLNV